MLSDYLRKFVGVLWLLPGFLLWAAYPPMGEMADVVFALAPLLWLSRQGDVGVATKRWFVNGLFFWFATLFWMPAIVKNGGPWTLVVLGWAGLALYCAAYFAAYGYLSARYWRWARISYTRRLFGVLLVEPILWCGLEWVRSNLGGGFAWNHLGVPIVAGGCGSVASLGGVYLCSAIAILINGTFVGIAERMMRKVPRYAGIETVLVMLFIFGWYRLAKVTAPNDELYESMNVGLAQRNFPCVFKGNSEVNPYHVYAELLARANQAGKLDLLVLPESAMGEFGVIDGERAMEFASAVNECTHGASIIAGGSRFADDKQFNSAAYFSFSPTTGVGTFQLYDKVHLVPFGEFIPGDKYFPILKKLAPVGSCSAGTPHLIGDKYGVAICFEDTDASHVRALARQGAKALFFITNDSWFSRSVECEQHAWQALARAIETNLPVARVGNNGYTGFINPSGSANWLRSSDGKIMVDRHGILTGRMLMCSNPSLTWYVKIGDYPLIIAFSLLILGMILVKYKHHYEKRRNMSM